jgi:UPF0716 protein FxsA
MLFKLFLAFTLIPIAELYLIIKIGSLLGTAATVGVILLTGITGAWLARLQGLKIVSKIQQQLQNGQLPQDEMIHGIVVLAGGITLLTPGFITDFIGLSLIFPLTRPLYVKWLKKYFVTGVNSQTWVVQTKHSGPRDERPVN